jgi:hypothetical protein
VVGDRVRDLASEGDDPCLDVADVGEEPVDPIGIGGASGGRSVDVFELVHLTGPPPRGPARAGRVPVGRRGGVGRTGELAWAAE